MAISASESSDGPLATEKSSENDYYGKTNQGANLRVTSAWLLSTQLLPIARRKTGLSLKVSTLDGLRTN